MVAATRHYRIELQAALDDALNAYDIAAQKGNIRAMLLSRACATYPLFELADFARVLEFADEMIELADRLGASGWRSSALDHKARALYRQGKRREALEAAEEALALSRSTAMQFVGPRVLGLLALLTGDQTRREEALAEGDELLHAGSVSHNHLWFHRHGIELALEEGNWGAMEQHARALENYTSSEPLPLIDFYISRAGVLSTLGRGTDVERAYHELQQLLEQGRNTGLWNAVEALEAALESK